MSLEAGLDRQTIQSQQLLQMQMHLSAEEISNLRRLLQHAEKMKRNSSVETKNFQHQLRFLDQHDGGPVWDLDFIAEFNRMACYDNAKDDL